jgi:glucose-6-phosphate isomerase
MAQLYFGGPRTIFHMCVGALRSDADIAVQAKENRMLPELVPDVSGTDVNTILDAIRSGVFATFEKEGIPYLSIEMKDLSTQSIGALLQYHMLQIMYLAELMNVNAFDQPNVESYKIETRRLLKKNT